MMRALEYLKLKIVDNGFDARNARRQERGLRKKAKGIAERGLTHKDEAIRALAVEDYKHTAEAADTLYIHRKRHLASEQRSALLVYGFFRGLAYHDMENKTFSYPDWTDKEVGGKLVECRMVQLVREFSAPADQQLWVQKFAQWRDAADDRLHAEFKEQAKLEPRPRWRVRRVVDQLVRSEAQARGVSISAVLQQASIPAEEWNDIVIGAVPFTQEHAGLLCGALSLPPQVFMAIEEAYKKFPPHRTNAQKRKDREARKAQAAQ